MRKPTMLEFTIMILGIAMFLLFWFNFETTRQTFTFMLGTTELVTIISIAMSMIDAAGIAMIVATKNDRDKTIESSFAWLMILAWMLAALGDIALTWAWAATRLEEAPVVLSGKASQTAVYLIPWAVALMEFGMRVPLVLGIGKLLSVRMSPKMSHRPDLHNMPARSPSDPRYYPPIGVSGGQSHDRRTDPQRKP